MMFRKREIDTRMVECIIKGYSACPAKCIEACLCSQIPYDLYLKALEDKDREQVSRCPLPKMQT